MNRLTLALIAVLTLAAAGCATLPGTSAAPATLPAIAATDTGTPSMGTPAPVTPTLAPTASAGIPNITGLLAFARTDVQNALDGATQFNDPVGIQCHTAGLKVLDTIGLPHVKVSGVASLAEDLRVKQRAITAAMPLIQDAKDKCAGVFNVGQLLRPIGDALGIVIP